jgi:hypothetical protein
MKTKTKNLLLLTLLAMVVQGCIAFPPLIQVEHKDGDNKELLHRLDSIDRRLDALEQKK